MKYSVKTKKYLLAFVSALSLGLSIENGWSAAQAQGNGNGNVNNTVVISPQCTLKFEDRKWYKNNVLLNSNELYNLLNQDHERGLKILWEILSIQNSILGIDTTEQLISHMVEAGHLGKIYGAPIKDVKNNFKLKNSLRKMEINTPVSYFKYSNYNEHAYTKYFEKILPKLKQGMAFVADDRLQMLYDDVVNRKSEKAKEILHTVLLCCNIDVINIQNENILILAKFQKRRDLNDNREIPLCIVYKTIEENGSRIFTKQQILVNTVKIVAEIKKGIVKIVTMYPTNNI